MAIQPPKLFHQHLAAYLAMAINNIFSSTTTAINHLKANYHRRVRTNRFKLLLQEHQEAENAKIQRDWIYKHRQEI